MERENPHVPEPDDVSQPRAPDNDDRGAISFWSIIYSVITHPFRVIGNICWSRRRTSEDHSPGRIQDTIEYREKKCSAKVTNGLKILSKSLNNDESQQEREHSTPEDSDIDESSQAQDGLINTDWRGAASTSEPRLLLRPSLPSKWDDSVTSSYYSARRRSSVRTWSSERFQNHSREVTLSDIGKIEPEKPVVVLHPPAPPPPNPPI